MLHGTSDRYKQVYFEIGLNFRSGFEQVTFDNVHAR